MRRFFLALAFLVAAPLSAATYYAATTGSGTTCSLASPCTLLYLAQNKVVAGDTVWVRGGTYTLTTNEPYMFTRAGTLAQPIIYRNYNNEKWVIDCNGDTSGSGIGTNYCFGTRNSYVYLWGVYAMNSATTTRFMNHGHASVTNGSPTLTWVDGSSEFIANPTGTVNVTNGSTAVTWASGTVFTVGANWPGKRIVLDGVTYIVAGPTVPDSTHLTLTTNYAGATAAVAATLPGLQSNLTFTIGTTNGVGGTAYTCSYCSSTTSCTLTTNFVGTNGTKETHFPDISAATLHITGLNGVFLGYQGSKIINSFIFDNNGGTTLNGAFNGDLEMYGDVWQYSGGVADGRAFGHGGYFQNLIADGESGRSYITDNIFLRPFDLGFQMYSTNTEVSYMTANGNVIGAPGHAKYPTATWPATGQAVSGPAMYLGTSGSKATSCTSSTKVLTGTVIDKNWIYAPTNSGFNLGGGKGSCSTTITDNRLIAANQPPILADATFSPLTITGNTFMFGTDTSSGTDRGGPAPLFTAANYPSNTFLSAVPSSGADVFLARPNAYESGRGFIAIDNQDSSSTVTIPSATLTAAGCYAGEAVRLFNWQDNDPWASTPIATQTGCGDVVVPATCTGSCVIRQPGFTQPDGSTAFPKPPDLGPRFLVVVMYPDWLAGATPTPTNTPTNTATRTFTATSTFTPTFTPSLTPTATRTFTASATPSQSPTPTPTFTHTPTITPTFTQSPTPTETPVPLLPSLSFSVSSCIPSLPMVVQSDAGAFGGYSASSVIGDSGMLVCNFTVPVSGLYRFWTRVYGESGTQDSFYTDMDGDGSPTCTTDTDTSCPNIFDIAERKLCLQDPTDPHACEYSVTRQAWIWNPINARNSSCGGCTGNYSEKQWTLSTGMTHTLTFRTRDKDSKIAWVVATMDMTYDPNPNPPPPAGATNTPTGTVTPPPSFTPTSTGTVTPTPTARTPTPTPTPCPGCAQLKHQHTCNHKTGYHTHANIGPHTHVPCPWQ